MKLCNRCGAHNADDRILCVDCGETLGAKLTPEQEKEHNAALSKQLEKLYNRRNPLYVSLFDKIVGVITSAGAIGALAGLIFAMINGQETAFFFLSLLFLAVSAMVAFVPSLLWALEKVCLMLTLNGDIEPGLFYWIGRKVALILTAITGLVVLALAFL